MQSYTIDKGVDFGKWDDNISKLLYFDSTKEILKKIHPIGKIADYGRANGLIKTFIPNIITIDIDKTKKPDIIDDIITHIGKYDWIIIRYVLHYLNDYELLQLFDNIASYHKGKVLIQQFINDDLKNKYFNSKNEFKYFRTETQLEALLPDNIEKIYTKEYYATEEFYKNRLSIENCVSHFEKINAYLINYEKNRA